MLYLIRVENLVVCLLVIVECLFVQSFNELEKFQNVRYPSAFGLFFSLLLEM